MPSRRRIGNLKRFFAAAKATGMSKIGAQALPAPTPLIGPPTAASQLGINEGPFP
jgi:hypothetical protein